MPKDFFVGRQPIFDRNERLWGFELLFREGVAGNFAQIDDPDAATILVASNGYLRATSGISEGIKIFINFTEELIFNRFPLALPVSSTVIELLENIPVTDQLIDRLCELKDEGYLIALDDFVGGESYRKILKYIDIIKLDCIGRETNEIIKIKNDFSNPSCLFLAEKVDSEMSYHALRDEGIDLFQGYYFATPQILKEKNISSETISRLNLAAEIEKDDLDIEAVFSVIRNDISLTYRLLRYINSSAFSFQEKISSIKQAFNLLGVKKTKHWLRLVIYADLLSPRANPEVLRMAIQRATFLDNLGREGYARVGSESLFLIGMLSLLDVILQTPMQIILRDLPVSSQLKATLLGGETNFSDYLLLARAMEHGLFDQARVTCQKLGVPEQSAFQLFSGAIEASDTFANQVTEA